MIFLIRNVANLLFVEKFDDPARLPDRRLQGRDAMSVNLEGEATVERFASCLLHLS